MQSVAKSIVKNYRERKRDERRLFRCKKRELDRREQVDMHRCRNDARKFYQNVKRLTEGYKPAAFFCKDEKGNLVTGPQGC